MLCKRSEPATRTKLGGGKEASGYDGGEGVGGGFEHEGGAMKAIGNIKPNCEPQGWEQRVRGNV